MARNGRFAVFWPSVNRRVCDLDLRRRIILFRRQFLVQREGHDFKNNMFTDNLFVIYGIRFLAYPSSWCLVAAVGWTNIFAHRVVHGQGRISCIEPRSGDITKNNKILSTNTATNGTTIVPQISEYHAECLAHSFVVGVLWTLGSTPLVISNIISFDFQHDTKLTDEVTAQAKH